MAQEHDAVQRAQVAHAEHLRDQPGGGRYRRQPEKAVGDGEQVATSHRGATQCRGSGPRFTSMKLRNSAK